MRTNITVVLVSPLRWRFITIGDNGSVTECIGVGGEEMWWGLVLVVVKVEEEATIKHSKKNNNNGK